MIMFARALVEKNKVKIGDKVIVGDYPVELELEVLDIRQDVMDLKMTNYDVVYRDIPICSIKYVNGKEVEK